MGKTKRGEKEFTREQRLIQENRILKRQVAHLRKELARIDLDGSNLKQTIEKHYQEDFTQQGLDIIERLRQVWRCTGTPGCEGYLEIILYNKINATWYYRKCNCCAHRTKSQKYDPAQVKGILKESIFEQE